jgi:hypothetical protein
MSHVHVKINFSFGIDSWNRCLSVHKRLQIRAQRKTRQKEVKNGRRLYKIVFDEIFPRANVLMGAAFMFYPCDKHTILVIFNKGKVLGNLQN